MEPAILLPSNKPETLYSVVVEIAAADKGHIPATLSRALHSMVMNWLKLANSQIAAEIHDSQVSPLSLSGLLGNRRRGGVKSGDNFYCRISLLDGSLLPVLLAGIEAWGTEPLVLGKFPFVLRTIYTLPGTHRFVSAADYRLLATTPQMGADIELRFLSPTSFKQSRSIQTFPLPELVFGSLWRRWNTFAPDELRFPDMDWQGLVLAYELKTYAQKMEGGAEIGAQGWVRYRFRELEQIKVATILSHFAFFSGVGRKTSMGMGQVQQQR